MKISELIRVDKTWEGGEHETRKRIIRGQCPEQSQLTAQLYTSSDNALQLHQEGNSELVNIDLPQSRNFFIMQVNFMMRMKIALVNDCKQFLYSTVLASSGPETVST